MTKAETWTQRIEEWKSSGLSAKSFCAGRDFGKDALYRWARRLGRTEENAVPQRLVPLARVLRRPVQAPAPLGTAVCIELAGARVIVAAGVDRATLSLVLNALESRPHGGTP